MRGQICITIYFNMNLTVRNLVCLTHAHKLFQQEYTHKEKMPIEIHTENFTTKKLKFSDKDSDIFHISVQNVDCGYSLEPPRRGGSNEYPQSMFLSRNKKNNVYPCKPQFYYIKLGFKGSKLYRYVLCDAPLRQSTYTRT